MGPSSVPPRYSHMRETLTEIVQCLPFRARSFSIVITIAFTSLTKRNLNAEPNRHPRTPPQLTRALPY
uniref:Uncharacterized protein n=1 Tax=Arundo donax TaxID=35708 RepID=A0A0A9CY04_ARUDO